MARRGRLAWAWTVAALTAAVFARSLGAGFVGFDDPFVILGNPHFRGFTAANARWMLGFHWFHWYPLTWLSFALNHALFGMRPFGFHLFSVGLHALNAALAFLLFDRLMERGGARGAAVRRAAAAFGALVFALHPLRVESVAWATERSDVLAAAFSLGTALAWLEERDGAALALHALALASKGTAIGVPAVLALLELLGLSGRRKRAGTFAWLAAMAALSAADAGLNALCEFRGAAWGLDRLGVGSRLAIGAWNFAYGPLATLWPARLEALYPLPRPFDPAAPRFLLAAAGVALATAWAWRERRRAPALAAAWGASLLIMVPMAGFVKVGPQLMADRYTYLALIGFAGLGAEGLRRALSGRRARAAAAAAAGLLLLLAVLSWRAQAAWRDADSLWNAMIAADPANAPARRMAGLSAWRAGDAGRAERLFRDALAADPDDGAARGALANLLADTGRAAESLPLYRALLAASPERPIVRYNFALALIRLGRRGEAAGLLRDELALIARLRAASPPDENGLRRPGEPDAARTRALLDSLSEISR